jgi:hypothetical protein
MIDSKKKFWTDARPLSADGVRSAVRIVAEREGFEPPDLSINGFQDRRLKPLGHLSVRSMSAYLRGNFMSSAASRKDELTSFRRLGKTRHCGELRDEAISRITPAGQGIAPSR